MDEAYEFQNKVMSGEIELPEVNYSPNQPRNKDGEWTTSGAGGSRNGSGKAGRSSGKTISELDPPIRKTHSVKLPPDPKKLSIATAASAMNQLGYTLGKGKFDLKLGSTAYEVSDRGGHTVLMRADDMKKLVYSARAKK
jgi:hypothetical protein